MNTIRLAHYPRSPYLYEVCDSLGLFVADENADGAAQYDTAIGRKLTKEMVTTNVNHPSIIMWDNGNEGNFNYNLVQYFKKWDIQKRPINYPGGKYNGIDASHYPDFQELKKELSEGNRIIFPDEFLHALYDGGGGAGLLDFWTLMRSSPRSAGGVIWDYSDGCVVRTDKGDSLDCDGNNAPDGILGPYREKEGSFYAIKAIWSPVQIRKPNLTKNWSEKILVGNRYNFTNLKKIKFVWKLINFPDPFDKTSKNKIISEGKITSSDIQPQSQGYLQLHLPSGWYNNDALQVKAIDPHGREVYQWTFSIQDPSYYAKNIIPKTNSNIEYHVEQTDSSFILISDSLIVKINKENGYIQSIQKGKRHYSLNNGPFLVGDHCSLRKIKQKGKTVQAFFSGDDYKVTYSLRDDWLKVTYSYKPLGKYPYFGISFNYPEQKINGIKWLGNGPDRVWKNRLKGMEMSVWQKNNNKYPDKMTIHGYHWNIPKFNGYYANLNWAVLSTTEGNITMLVDSPGLYLGLLKPQYPPHPKRAKAEYPKGDISILNAISPMGSKFNNPSNLGPSGAPNLFKYNSPFFKIKNTLWLRFDKE